MIKKEKIIIWTLCMLAFALVSMPLTARPKEVTGKDKGDEMLRAVNNLYDLEQNTVSNIQFYTTNYGIFGLNVAQNRGGGFWPRGSENQYIFAGGIWFGAVKLKPNDSINHQTKKYVTITYNPNNGLSWMVPGRMNPNNTSQDMADQTNITKYRTYFSTDFKSGDGSPVISTDGENWPIWNTNPDDTLKRNRYFGYFIDDATTRNRTTYPKGPAFISAEDIFATFKDTDLSRYDGGAGKRRNDGYPLRLQFEQNIYSWGFGDYRDFIFLRYDIQNYSKDTLKDCWMAPVMDVDIAVASNSQNGAANDRCRYYSEDPTLNLAIMWSNTDQGEKGKGFGYIGFDFLESPSIYQSQWKTFKIDTLENDGRHIVTNYDISEFMSLKWVTVKVPVYDNSGVQIGTRDSSYSLNTIMVRHSIMKINDSLPPVNKFDTTLSVQFDSTGYLRKDRRYYDNADQIGLTTFRNWDISQDIPDDDGRYNFMSSRKKDGDNGPGDKRLMMATGPFNMRPQDTARVVIGVILGNPSVLQDPDGSTADLKELVRKDNFAQQVYEENFRAPVPPDRARLFWSPLNNAVKVWWDSTSEVSSDEYEDGMAFLGYRLFRARRTNLDTFTTSVIGPTSQNPMGSGPFGWKQIATWEIPTPFLKSYNRSGTDPNNTLYPLLDSMKIVGPVYNNGILDTFAIKVMRVGRGIKILSDSATQVFNIYRNSTEAGMIGSVVPAIALIDTGLINEPWNKYYADLEPRTNGWPSMLLYYNPFNPTLVKNELFDSVLIGQINLNRAQLLYNPLLSQLQTIVINASDTALLPKTVADTIYLRNTIRKVNIPTNPSAYLIDRIIPLAVNLSMKDSKKVRSVLDSVYSYIKRGIAKAVFPKFEQSSKAKLNVIIPYMRKQTNNNTFLDIGDDSRDAYIQKSTDPTTTQKLLNNVDYFYKLLAYDEGDYNQPTNKKTNDATEGLPNLVKSHPAAPPAGTPSTFQITFLDTAKIGGLYNFKCFPINQDRVNQLFAGHEFELEFIPNWSYTQLKVGDRNYDFGLYLRNMRLTDLTTGDLLFNGNTFFEQTPCQTTFASIYSENGKSVYLSDSLIVDPYHPENSVSFGLFNDKENITRTASFNSGDYTQPAYCYAFAFLPPAMGTLGFSFDFTLQQQGGHFRPDSASQRSELGKVPYYPRIDTNYITTTRVTGATTYGYDLLVQNGNIYSVPAYGVNTYGSYNNGPGDYEITFSAGGTEQMDLTWGPVSKRTTKTFSVPYLTMNIQNTRSYQRPGNNNDSVKVGYPAPLVHMVLDTAGGGLPEMKNLGQNNNDFIGKYNLRSFGWIDGRGNNKVTVLPAQRAQMAGFIGGTTVALNVGTQGRYYLSCKSDDQANQLDFENEINISGCHFVFDYANKSRIENTSVRAWPDDNTFPIDPATYVYGDDFKPGDKVTLKVSGGAFGLPMPGAKVRFKVSPSIPEINNYTNELMNQVTVVPNPYYITHQMQQSPYDMKLYFNKLPSRCTISIYTAAGDLVKTFEHSETSADGPYTHAVDVWDLLSSNKQRVQSQTLVALIKAPNGAESVVQFSVVVGGFRLIPAEGQ